MNTKYKIGVHRFANVTFAAMLLLLSWGDRVAAGESDDVEVYREHGLTYVLSRNHGLGYVGLEVFEGATLVGETFLQVDYEIAETLGRDGLDRAGWWIAKQLAEYVCT